MSIRDLADACDINIYRIRYHINKLKKAGVIRHVGPTKAGRWEVREG